MTLYVVLLLSCLGQMDKEGALSYSPTRSTRSGSSRSAILSSQAQPVVRQDRHLSRVHGPSQAGVDHRRLSRDRGPSQAGVDHRRLSRDRGPSQAGVDHRRSRSRFRGPSQAGVDHRRSRSRVRGPSQAGVDHRRSRSRVRGPSQAGVDHRRSRSRVRGPSQAGVDHRRSRSRDRGPSQASVDHRRLSRDRGPSQAGVDHRRSRSRDRGPSQAGVDHRRSRSRDRGPSQAGVDHRRSRSRDRGPSQAGVDHRRSRSRDRGLPQASVDHRRSRSRDRGSSQAGVDHHRSRSRVRGSSQAGVDHRRSRSRVRGPSQAGVDHHRLRRRDRGLSRAGVDHRRLRSHDHGPSQAGVDHRRLRGRDCGSSQAGVDHRRLRSRDRGPSRAVVDHRHLRSRDRGPSQAGVDHRRQRSRDRGPSQAGVDHRHLRSRDRGPSQAGVDHRRQRSRDRGPSPAGVDVRRSRSRVRGLSQAGVDHRRQRSRDRGPSQAGVYHRRSCSHDRGPLQAGVNHLVLRSRDRGASRAGVDNWRSRSRSRSSMHAGHHSLRRRDRRHSHHANEHISPTTQASPEPRRRVTLQEPPHHIEFTNDTGATLSCTNAGNYQLDWLLADSTPVTSVANLRRVLANGSLELAPFPADLYRRDVHSTNYRCRVRLSSGYTVMSKYIHVHAVVHVPWELHVPDEYVMSGNSAVLRCVAPTHCADRIATTDWLAEDELSVLEKQNLGSKYQLLDDGSLYISAVSSEDQYNRFRCRVRDRITGAWHISQYYGHVIVTEPKGSVRPRVAMETRSRRVAVGHDVRLPCAARAWPVPTYRWFREHRDQLTPLEETTLWGRARLLGGGGLLLLRQLQVKDAGRIVCWLNNTAGGDSMHFTLSVTEPIVVRVKPDVLRPKLNSDIVLDCKVSGRPIELVYWLHNGRPLQPNERVQMSEDGLSVHITKSQKEDQGIYQCFASNSKDQAYGLAEINGEETDGRPRPAANRSRRTPFARSTHTHDAEWNFTGTRESKPELVYWFSEQTLQPGPSVSLKCVAMGHPPPQFTWILDGFPIPTNSRFVVGQHVTLQDDVVSHLNISRVTEQDGGEYACVASNTAGKALHAARVNVYGLPYIREMPKVSAVAGTDLVIKCPVAGYPIESITWEREGQTLPLNRRQRVFPNGTLVVEQTQRNDDAGTYTCQATNRQRHVARRDVDVQILVQPKILPIQPMTNLLREGMRAAISCQILEGDLPIAFRWEKNGQPVVSSPYAPSGIITRRMDEYSTSLVIEHITSLHSGNYTCIASNVAGSERFTVPLTVNVPPRWRLEPNDVAVAAGQDVTLQCQADGYPKPTITWKKAVGNSSPGEYKDFMFDGNSRVLENGSLIFERVAKDGEGHYLCEARNEIGAGLSKLIFFKVNAPARFPMKSKTVQVTAGEAAHLQCAASGDAPLEVSWRSPHHHTIAHHLDQRYTIREQVLDDGIVSELSILQTYRQDTGALTCRASNAYGQDEMLIHLVVQEVPEMPKNIRIIDQQSRTIQISWTQPYAGNSPIINYIVQFKEASEPWPTTPQKVIVPGSVTSASVQNLQPATSYHLRIIAENRLGQSEPSQLVQVTTTEEVPSGPPLDVRVESKSSTELVVSWEPPQRDLWNGNILGYYVGFQELNSNSSVLSASGPGGASYTVRTVEGAGTARSRTTISGLQKHAAYAVVVQAYNSRGAGPASPPTTATTMEDVPSLPPGSLQCTALSSQSVRVAWEPPPMRGRNGVLQGYRVTYAPVTDWYGSEDAVTKQISGLHTTLSGLRRYTNYSVTVCAFTAAGDGVRAAPVYCHTEEDVPSAPADIKAAVSTRNKILVSWLPPANPNGVLVGYTLYMSVIEDGREEGTHKRMLSPSTLSHETARSPPRATHQFWVSASTRLGEGETTRVVTVLPSDSVPARITSFSRSIVTPWKENISLSCNKVGVPTPSTMWSMNGASLESTLRKNVTSDGTLIISMTQYADSGNYTCFVENVHGRDEVTYSVEVKVPPQPPVLAVVDSYADSLHLQWSDQGDGGSPILGYVINYKREHGDWEELQVEAGTSEHVLPNLWCGTRYQLYITAFNRIGTGLPCDIVHAYTKGTVPVKPKHSQMITLNTTTVTVWLDSWGDGGCGILYFVIEYREMSQSQWRLVSNSVQATERVFSVTGLTPATQYQLRITAHNNAGHAVALYNFTTHSLSGMLDGELAPPVTAAGNRSLGGARVILPAALSLLVLGALIAIVLLVRRNKSGGTETVATESGVGESPSVAQLQNKVNRDQQYLATRAQHPAPPQQYKHASNEYIEDICPYATFQLTKPTAYSESSYSGNVYSGPYHSVRGSFVYHDVKQPDKYKGKEPEYTKVRRKGNRLRDPHSESQESDNLGSTDSEVKKILTLHLPITEYEDDASDDASAPAHSDSETGARMSRPPHPTSYPSVEREESSSSSGDSLGGVVRKAFPSRKGKAGAMGKRHVRSSSGYSSHNDETTFSISNYPSFNDHIHPPSRFSDDTECEGHHRRRRAPHPHPHTQDGKITREAFQINV